MRFELEVLVGLSRPTLAAILVVFGCSQPTPDPETARLKGAIDSLRTRVTSLEFEQQFAAPMLDSATSAYLSPGDDGFGVVRTKLGHVTVSLADVQPYASGVRVRLRFGNPTSAMLNGVSAQLTWSTLTSDGKPDFLHEQSRDVQFVEPFPAGSWTTVAAVLENVPNARLGFVSVDDVRVQQLRMYGR